jgi:hypothetical protein
MYQNGEDEKLYAVLHESPEGNMVERTVLAGILKSRAWGYKLVICIRIRFSDEVL